MLLPVSVVAAGLVGVAGPGGCAASPTDIEDPLVVLGELEAGPRRQQAAMEALDAEGPREAYLDALARTIWRPGYTVDVRMAAAERLERYDVDRLKRTLRQQLPRMTAWDGVTRLSEMIADRGWTELTPALVSSWSRALPGVDDERERPECVALSRMYGEGRISDVVFDLLVSSTRVSQQGLRTRCWRLLHRLGERDRLIELLREHDVPEDDAFLFDLKVAADELGLVPYNREEILWLRKLREPSRRVFWDEAVSAVAQVPPRRRAALAIRDVPVVVSVVRHAPELLTLSDAAMYERIERHVRAQRHHAHGSNYDNFNPSSRDRLHHWRDELSWGDLAAMLMAVQALDVPEVIDHLFDYAERDRLDETTEYGGVIALDRLGRFEILEFPPRIRHHDRKFIASQEMMDAGYTSLFHFHMHVQRHRNQDYAGPGFGDVNYADATRANCLVLTFVREDILNVDFYRHDRLQVDLGEVRKRL